MTLTVVGQATNNGRSNPEDEMKILDEGFQQQMADKIVMGLKDFLAACKEQ